MNLYGFWFFAPQNRFNRVSQQTFLNNIQPGGPSRRHISLRRFLVVPAALLALVIGPARSQAASLTSTPSSVSFGTVTVGNKNTQTLAIKNASTSTAVVSSYSISGSGFSVSSLATPFSLSSGTTTYFAVGFKPTASGSFTGSLTLKNSSGTVLVTIGLSGSGSGSTKSLVSSTSKLSFGNETVGDSETLAVALINTGNSSVTISGVSISGSSAYSVTSGISGATLAAGQTATMHIVFAPKSTGTFNGTVTVVSNATNTAPAVAVSGSGISNTSHSVALSWSASTSSGVIGYNVYRSTVSGTSYIRINSSPTASLKYTDGSVASGETYYYVVKAVNSSGAESARSSQTTAVIP
jgi:Cep192 domain 4/Abnormal spindle-like microcephaly-assoc'd, ASPM-SPD-2-Hydin